MSPCAEEIQDQAIRCKHCGGDLKAHAAATTANGSKAGAKSLGTVISAVIGAFAGYFVATQVTTSSLKTFESIALAAVIFPAGWALGRTFEKSAQPSIVFDSDVVRLGVRRVGYSLMPLAFAMVGGIASLYLIGSLMRDNPAEPPAAIGSQSDATSSTNAQTKLNKKKKRTPTAVPENNPNPQGAEPATK